MRVIGPRSVLVSGLFLSIVVGCGSSGLEYTTASVQGEVTYQGKPLASGLIRFIPTEEVAKGQVAGKPIFAKIENGKYALAADKGATVGNNRVEITSYRGTGRMVQMSNGKKEEEQKQFIPEQYNTASTLSVEIKEGENQHDFALE